MSNKIKRIFIPVLIVIALASCTASNSKTLNEIDQTMIIKKPSPYSASETIDRLENILNAKGLTVFTRVDHGAGAAKVDLKLGASELIIFGNPKLGTPLMQENPEMGLDLPLKALAYTDADGQTYLTYTAPASLETRHNIQTHSAIIEKMTGALDAMTNKAVEAE